jgi:hypothetical protein
MATLDKWNFFNHNVQGGLMEGRYVNAAFTLIAAGPPRLGLLGGTSGDATSSGVAFPIGIIQNFNLGQNAQVLRLFEIGSERSYFIRGRTMGNLGIGRIMYHGPSLLRVLYAYMEDPDTTAKKFKSLYLAAAGQQTETNASNNANMKKKFEINPGASNIWLDLASDVFSQPIGLMMIMRDSNNATVGAFYFEYCMVVNHGFATDAGGVVISENAGIMYERIVPVDTTVVDLIQDSSSLTAFNEVIGSAADGA